MANFYTPRVSFYTHDVLRRTFACAQVGRTKPMRVPITLEGEKKINNSERKKKKKKRNVSKPCYAEGVKRVTIKIIATFLFRTYFFFFFLSYREAIIFFFFFASVERTAAPATEMSFGLSARFRTTHVLPLPNSQGIPGQCHRVW